MTTIRDAITSLGIGDTDDGIVVLALYADATTRQPWHATLDDVGDRDVAMFQAVYVASGLFRPGAIVDNRGRTTANVARVNWLTLDCDLKDYLGVADQTEIHALPHDALDTMIAEQARTVTTILQRIGIPAHRIVSTGYGIAIHVRVRDADGDCLDGIPALHKALVARINAIAGYTLADPKVADGGARITRVPGSRNTKAATPRTVTVIAEDRVALALHPVTLASLLEVGATPTPIRQSRAATHTLSDDLEADIIGAIAPHWTLGQKHSLALALSGMLAKAGVAPESAVRIVTQLAADDRLPWDRQKAVQDSYARVASGLDTQGYTGLVGMLPDTVLRYVDARLQQVRRATTTALVTVTQPGQDDDDIIRSVDPKPVPEICFSGWLARYVDLVTPLCEAPPQFHLASAMVLAGATFGRRLGVEYVSKVLYPNMYVMLVGVAGNTRKDTAIEFALDLPSRRGDFGASTKPFEIITDVGSAEGLIQQLAASPDLLLYVTEYQRLAQNAARKATSSITPTLTAAFNAPASLSTGTREETNIKAKLPTLSILAAVQPDILADAMSTGEMSSGYASRWLMVPGKRAAVMPDPPSIDERAAYTLYQEVVKTADAYGNATDRRQTVLRLTPAASERWNVWYHDDDARGKRLNETEHAVASRLAVYIRKAAAIYAGLEHAQAIELHHLEAAIAWVEWSWTHTFQLMQTWGTSFWGQIEERIRVVLQRGGPMPRRRLHQQCRNRRWDAREFNQVLEALVKIGVVDVDPGGTIALAA